MAVQGPFAPEQIEKLSGEIDRQLKELFKEESHGAVRKSEPKSGLPAKQAKMLEEASGQDAPGFVARFKKAARADLCEEGGVLHAQWKKYADLSNKNVLQTFGAVLAAMGLSGNALQMAAVVLAVIVLHIGLKAFCMDPSPAEKP